LALSPSEFSLQIVCAKWYYRNLRYKDYGDHK
jgi:hypothetical protein